MKTKTHTNFTSSLLLALTVGIVTPCVAIDVPIADDAWVAAATAAVNYNYGAWPNLYVSGLATSIRWTYLQFNVANYIPAGTKPEDISRAVLRLYPTVVTTAGSFNVHTVSKTWIEGKSNGATATGMAISWNAKPTNDPLSAGTITLNTADADEFLGIDITEMVKAWITTPNLVPNFGLVLKPASGSLVNITFDSKENVTNCKQPSLDITLVKKRVLPLGDVGMGVFNVGTQPSP